MFTPTPSFVWGNIWPISGTLQQLSTSALITCESLFFDVTILYGNRTSTHPQSTSISFDFEREISAEQNGKM